MNIAGEACNQEPTLALIASGEFVAQRLSCFRNFGGHKFKDNREVETAVIRWLITQDPDWHHRSIEKLVPEYDEKT
jgi:hypothetical protein